MRLGKPLEHLQAALRVTQSSTHSAEHITTIGKQISYFGYLSYDAVAWANAVKFISLKPETAQSVARISNRFWLAGIFLSIAHGALKVRFVRSRSGGGGVYDDIFCVDTRVHFHTSYTGYMPRRSSWSPRNKAREIPLEKKPILKRNFVPCELRKPLLATNLSWTSLTCGFPPQTWASSTSMTAFLVLSDSLHPSWL